MYGNVILLHGLFNEAVSNVSEDGQYPGFESNVSSTQVTSVNTLSNLPRPWKETRIFYSDLVPTLLHGSATCVENNRRLVNFKQRK
jgi:hypothetical protein